MPFKLLRYLPLPAIILMMPPIKYFATGAFEIRTLCIAFVLACVSPMVIYIVVWMMFKMASKGK